MKLSKTRRILQSSHGTSYIFLLETGKASPKDVQELARHSTLDLTMNTYGRAREDRTRAAVEQVGELVEPAEKCVTCVHQGELGAEKESATPSINKGLRFQETGSGGRT